ncbi:MAG: alpha/beta hydrolase [Proteobacteria bacterium]|nr:alpha/beta hydrolase [Pseudomonadota bacterium]
MSKPIVLIPGAFAGSWVMENLTRYFSEKGFDCHAPTFRHHLGKARDEADPALAGTSIEDYTRDIAELIKTLPEKPILFGHAVGAVIAQKLAAQGLASAVILINSNGLWGMLPPTEEERNLGRDLMAAAPFADQTMRVDFDMMAAFALNKMTPDQQHDVFDRLEPESSQVMFELFYWMFDNNRAIYVDTEKVTCPVLVLTGAEDKAVSTETAKALAEKYGDRATFYQVPDAAHFMMMEDSWPKLADYCLEWMTSKELN